MIRRPQRSTQGRSSAASDVYKRQGRGCTVPDVLRTIFYIMEQDYETGQAYNVTGGQEMR